MRSKFTDNFRFTDITKWFSRFRHDSPETQATSCSSISSGRLDVDPNEQYCSKSIETGSDPGLDTSDTLCANDEQRGKYLERVVVDNKLLKERLCQPISLKELILLRIEHNLPTYLRTKREIRAALLIHECDSDCSATSQSVLGKRARSDATSWPTIITDEEKKEIISEFIQRTSNSALKVHECSFCGSQVRSSKVKPKPRRDIDISLLLKNQAILREKHGNESIVVYKTFDNHFVLCAGCAGCVRKKKFVRVPLYSYANDCWIGAVPDELRGLSMLEELCIARVHSTKCTVKLAAHKYSQYASHGNVCVFPQDPKNLLTVLPPPLNDIYDEVAVILVYNKDSKITEEILHKSPLLVRRNKIRNALIWLKRHNKFYEDIEISEENLNQYTQNGVVENFPMQRVLQNDTEGCGYLPDQPNASANEIVDDKSHVPHFQTCGVLDSDAQEVSLNVRKLDMIKQLLNNKKPFVKFPRCSSEPLQTFKNGKVYALLWPTLFPYGIGVFDEDIKTLKNEDFRIIDMKRHIKHLMNTVDTRFQTHITFGFVMMNILQRRISSFESRLIVKRPSFKKVVDFMKKIDVEKLESVKNKMRRKKKLDENETERGVAKLLNYVDIISEDVSGSIGEVKKMKNEIRGIIREKGLPQLFMTINPADTLNPINQVMAGRDVDLDKVFHDLAGTEEEVQRLRHAVENPAAAARAFDHAMKCFTGTLLGNDRTNRVGLFGPLESYYGVVEAQARGSLHCHLFVWLKNALDPFEIRTRLQSDEDWKRHYTTWLESVIKQDFPENTSYELSRENKKKPVMSRPQNPGDFPKDENFNSHFNQDVRNVIHATGQIHEHSSTCFKHLPSIPSSYKFADSDCRFGLPREEVSETTTDEEGRVRLKCGNGNINGYNDVVVYCMRCNMDCKVIGSGTAAYAMTEYVGNYIAKISLDSMVVFCCFRGAIMAMRAADRSQPPRSPEEQARVLLLKICNAMIGKRELSGQQAMSYLQGIPNRYTNHQFESYYWSCLLRMVSRKHFAFDEHADEEYLALNSEWDEASDLAASRMPIIVQNYLYRPPELELICLWDFWSEYKIVYLKPIKDDDDGENTEVYKPKLYRFSKGHVQHRQKGIQMRSKKITPVLGGIQIPRSDKSPEEMEKNHIICLTLFKPWPLESCVLKSEEESWKEAYDRFLPDLSDEHKTLIKRFQAIHSCKDAADDFSKKRRKNMPANFEQMQLDFEDDIENDPNGDEDPLWAMAMDTECDNEDMTEDILDLIFPAAPSRTVCETISYTAAAGFYDVNETVPCSPALVKLSSVSDNDKVQKEFEEFLKSELKHNHEYLLKREDWTRRSDVDQEPFMTFWEEYQRNHGTAETRLYPHRKLCIEIIDRYTLNEKQSRAFLIFADRYGLKHCVKVGEVSPEGPIRLIISGPGGAGKSQIFQAMRCFLHVIGDEEKLKVTAPTGLAANNIGGTTIYSEVNLRIAPKYILGNDARGNGGRKGMEKRYKNTHCQIIDEVYFMGARDNSLLSQYLRLANEEHCNRSYGNLDMIFAGDPAQLPPPKKKSLFDHQLVEDANTKLNACNDRTNYNLSGVAVWREITDCVVLSEIMRQKEEVFKDILNRLRFGNCTEDDFDFLHRYVVSNRSEEENKKLLDISLWVTDPEKASILITYTNAVRDEHNLQCAEALACCTEQPFHLYHSCDIAVKGKEQLTGLAAEGAWQIPPKQAGDLAGRLPLVPHMPVFITKNIATDRGLSNGTWGTLVSVQYDEIDGRRYASSVEVDIPNFYGNDPDYPHRARLIPVSTSFTYEVGGRKHSVARHQIPVLPAFACTAHNSQSRTLNAACIDLASCRTIAAAYVMLSRLKSLEGLSILREFHFDKIHDHSAQQCRDEVERLDGLSEATKERCKRELGWYYDFIEHRSSSGATQMQM